MVDDFESALALVRRHFAEPTLDYYKAIAKEPCKCVFTIFAKKHPVATGLAKSRKEAAANANHMLTHLKPKDGPYFIKITLI